jgi:hypothetical protein
MDQRYLTLKFRIVDSQKISVDIPASPVLAPPGFYILFVLDSRSAASEGKIVQVGAPLKIGHVEPTARNKPWATPWKPELEAEYIQIINPSPVTVSLDDWSLEDASHHRIDLSGAGAIFPRQDVFVYSGRGTNNGSAFYANRRQAIWTNTGDTVLLLDPSGSIVDMYTYTY